VNGDLEREALLDLLRPVLPEMLLDTLRTLRETLRLPKTDR